MARPKKWPPTVHVHGRGYEFIAVTIDGKQTQIRLGPPGSTRARAKYAEVIAEVERSGTYLPPKAAASITVTALCRWWERWAEVNYRATSREPSQFRAVTRLLVALFPDVAARDVGPRHFRQLRDAMACCGWCRRVINRQMVRARTIFRRAVEEELVPASVYEAAKAVRGVPPNTPGVRESPPPAVATWEQVKAVIRHLGKVPRAMLLLQWFTGMRSGEVRLLRTADVDRHGEVWTYRPVGHKTAWRGHGRAVVIGPRGQRVLRCWLCPAQPAAYCFPAKRGPYSAFSYAQAVRRAARLAGLEGFHPYATRHAYKDRALAAGGVTAAMAALGQRSSTAFDGYGSPNLQAAQALARKIG